MLDPKKMSAYYFIEKYQNDLFRQVDKYMKDHSMSLPDIAIHLGISEQRCKVILAGNFDGRLSEYFMILEKIGKVAIINFEKKEGE